MRKVLRSVHVQTSARFEIPRKNNRHKTGFFPQTRSLWPAVKCLSLLSGGGKGYFFSVVLGLQSFSASSAWNARKVNNSQPKPLTIRNFPAILMEHLIFCQPARFLWGTDKVRNRFVGCPCNFQFFKAPYINTLNFILPVSSIFSQRANVESTYPDRSDLIRAISRFCFFFLSAFCFLFYPKQDTRD